MRLNMYNYLFNTWALSLPLFPVMICVSRWLRYWQVPGINPEVFVSFLEISFCTMIVSFPALFISMIALRMLLLSKMGQTWSAMLVWCLIITLAVTMEGLLLSLLFLGGLMPEVLLITVPGAVAGVAAALIRYKQFSRLFKSFRRPAILQHQITASL